MIGIRYLVTAIVFLVLGGLEALVMRVQLAHAAAGVVLRRNCTTSFSRCTG